MGLLALPMFFRTVMGEPHTTLEHFLAPLVIHERGYERTCTKTVRFERMFSPFAERGTLGSCAKEDRSGAEDAMGEGEGGEKDGLRLD